MTFCSCLSNVELIIDDVVLEHSKNNLVIDEELTCKQEQQQYATWFPLMSGRLD